MPVLWVVAALLLSTMCLFAAVIGLVILEAKLHGRVSELERKVESAEECL